MMEVIGMDYLYEFLGTFMLILLGDGVCCNVSLNKSGQKGGGSIQTGIAWGLAVLIPAFIFNHSGAHFNPAVTIALAVHGTFPWSAVAGYIVCQILGAFCGAWLLYFLFKDQFDATPDVATKRGVFCTGPSVRNYGRNFLSEMVCAFVLVFAILGEGNVEGLVSGVGYLFTYGIIVSVGMSLGGLTGYAMNPARDFGPRLAYATMPFKEKDPDWAYSWIPIIAPIVGGIIAALLYDAIF
ncbi:MAG: MIP/aquaporin family protein [Eubacteriales bacterium]|jgi:glycerol uptake facilitator protein